MMSIYPKGPWQIRRADNFDYLIQSEKCQIAVVGRKADADLIAAAPELLEALKLLISGFDENKFGNIELQNRKATGISKGLEAIAKAEGKLK